MKHNKIFIILIVLYCGLVLSGSPSGDYYSISFGDEKLANCDYRFLPAASFKLSKPVSAHYHNGFSQQPFSVLLLLALLSSALHCDWYALCFSSSDHKIGEASSTHVLFTSLIQCSVVPGHFEETIFCTSPSV